MYQIEARIVYENDPNHKWFKWNTNNKHIKHEWFRWGGTYKTMRRVLQSINDMNNWGYTSRVKYGKKGKWTKTWWEFRPIHFYKS